MSRNKPQTTVPQNINEIHGSDLFETPDYAITPLLPYLKKYDTIWEPAVGSGRILNFLHKQNHNLFGTDLKFGTNFFDYEPESEWDIIVTNPPYSIKFKWLRRCYELGKPFALLVPLETIGSSEAQEMLKEYGFEMMLLNSRVDFYTPNKGWDGHGAQFPVIWLTWKLLDQPIVFADIKKEKAEFKKSLKEIQNA